MPSVAPVMRIVLRAQDAIDAQDETALCNVCWRPPTSSVATLDETLARRGSASDRCAVSDARSVWMWKRRRGAARRHIGYENTQADEKSWQFRVCPTPEMLRCRLLSTAAAARQHFCLKTHTWVQKVQGGRVRLGLTERALEDIGDLVEANPLVDATSRVERSDNLLRISWTAMSISDGDELYHTRWANVEGEHHVIAPFACSVANLNYEALKSSDLDSSDWLIELQLPSGSQSDVDSQLSAYGLVAEDSYKASCGVGTFGESQEESLSYTSYG